MIDRRGNHKGKVPNMTHDELVNRAFHWLKNIRNCTVVFKERRASCQEEPDAIGFNSNSATILIECKASRSDFFADKKKTFRRKPERGMGYKRYFMAPVGLLEPKEMPDGWGLLEAYEQKSGVRIGQVRIAKDSECFFERNLSNEVGYLVSAIRRLNISMAVFIERV